MKMDVAIAAGRRTSRSAALLLSALFLFGTVACASDAADDPQPGTGGSGGQAGEAGTGGVGGKGGFGGEDGIGGQGGEGGAGGVEFSLTRVEVAPEEASVVERRTVQLSAKGFDEEDAEVEGLTFAWSSSDKNLATVDAAGLVTSLRPGVVTLTARVGDVVGEATLTITASTATSLELQADTTEVPLDGAVLLRPVVRDAEAFELLDREVVLESADEAIARIQDDTVVGVGLGKTKLTAKLEGLEDSIEVRVALRFTKIFAGGYNTCGLTAGGRPWCWGDGNALGAGPEDALSLDDVNLPHPVAAEPGLSFQTIVIGMLFACGLTTDEEVWCWGFNFDSVLGRDTSEILFSPVPLLLADRSYAALSSMENSVCGLDEEGYAHCWGANERHQLGDPENEEDHSWRPLEVSAPEGESDPVAFTEMRHGASFSCGTTSAGLLYCWGANFFSQLGDGTSEDRARAVKPLGDSAVKSFGCGSYFMCATTEEDDTYCWGGNEKGQAIFAPDDTANVETPTLRFDAATFVPSAFALGFEHGCVLDQEGRAHCWGSNANLQLGRETDGDGPFDVGEVVTDLRFTQLVAGTEHTCGLATDARVYCWGANADGQLGTGNNEKVEQPTPVAGQ